MLSIQRARGSGTALANLSHTNGSSNIRVRQVLRKSAGVLPLHARSFSTAQTQSNQGSDAEQSRMSLGFRLKKFFFGEKGTEPQAAQTQTQQTQPTLTKQPTRTVQKQQPTQPKPTQTVQTTQTTNMHPATHYKQQLLARQQTHTPRTHTQPQFRQPQKKPRHNYLRHTQNPRIQTPTQQTQTAQTQAQEQIQTELPPIASEKEINSYLNAREKITRITLHAQTETEKGETDEEIETEKEKTEREKEKERERRGQERDALSAMKKRETIASSELKLQPEEVQPPNEVCVCVCA